nr:hypothetical protein [Spirochaetota bacterium]
MKKIIFFALTLFLLFPTACKKEDVKGKKNGTIKILGSEDSADNPAGETKVINLDNAYDMSSKTINYYQEQALTDEEAKIKESEEPFVITDFGPKGELPAEMRKPTVYVSFNHPIIPLSKLGEVMKTSSIIKITPEVKGVYRFYGTRMLSFEPDESVLPQREYEVTVSKDLKSLGGKSITGETSFKFNSEYLRIVSFNPSYFDVPIKEAKTIRIVFSYPVNLDLIKKYLKIESNGKEYSFGIKSPGSEEKINEDLKNRTAILTADEEFEPNVDVKVTLLKDSKSEEGFLGTKNDIVNSFGTIRPFRFLTHQTYSYEFVGDDYSQTNPLYLTFTHPLDKDSVFKSLEISYSEVNINDHISVYDRTIKIFNLPVKYNSTYRVTVKPGLKDIYGRELSKEEKITVEVPDAYSYYYFPNLGDKILESQFPAKIAFELQNVFEGKWKVDSIADPFSLFGDDELVPYDFSKYEENMKYIEIIDLMPYLNKSGKGSVGLSWDFATRNYGYSYRQNLNLQVTDIGVSVRYGYNKFVVMASSLSTGDPISNAKVKLRTVWGKIFKEEKTDTNGVAIFELKEGDFKKNFYYAYNAKMERPRVIVEKDDDKVEFVPNGSHNVYQYGIYSTRSPSEVENEKEETFIFTDRGLYKPGETLTFR